ncbi:hypothetical protein NG799_28615 [Laspinema sp. D1]|uniref:Uncharacterized protein n=1 Tax=Laspinema palackyanum D2a TaxID=2953684 RepID=A0ABT2MZW7_9CYAN|nr:hypothetical protein [Laspinema sp. D2a]
MDTKDILQQLFIRYQLSAEDHGWDWEDPEDLRHKFENWAQTELMLFCDDDADFESAFKMGGKFVE